MCTSTCRSIQFTIQYSGIAASAYIRSLCRRSSARVESDTSIDSTTSEPCGNSRRYCRALPRTIAKSGSGSLAHLLAYARPVVASDIAPHREIARESPSCLALFRSGDPEDLARQIQAVSEDTERRAALQAAARAYAQRHSYAQMARETLAVYQSILKDDSDADSH